MMPLFTKVVTHTILVSIRQDWLNGLTREHASEVGVIKLNPVDNNINNLEVNLGQGSIWRGFLSMLKLGMRHISEGTDHLLFLLTLLLVAPLVAVSGRWAKFAGLKLSLRHILSIVSAFTLGHSLTLILATLLHADLPTQNIEIFIALSILISAIHALKPLFPNRDMLIAAGFGLIHGLAFSFTLTELKLSSSQLVLSLLGFNLGIELMQLLIIALIMPWLILLARTSFYASFRRIGAASAGIAALAWLFERLLSKANPVTLFVQSLADKGFYLLAGLALLALGMTLWQYLNPKFKSALGYH
ncbi:MAG: HupE/UreJ family protein [Deinococcales bacterium]